MKSCRGQSLRPLTVIGILASVGTSLGLELLLQTLQPAAVAAHATPISPQLHEGHASATSTAPGLASRPQPAGNINPHLWRDGAVDALGQPDTRVTPQRPGRRPSTPIVLPGERAPRGPVSPVNSSPPAEPAVEALPADPADAVAPAVIELTPRPQFLNLVTAQAMQRQLRSLIGRFESALLMASSLDSPTTLILEGNGANLTAADKENVDESFPAGDMPEVLAEAQQLLEDWDTLIATGDHTAAQNRWLQARQALWNNMPAERPYAQAEIRAIWLDRGTIVEAGSAAGLATLFDQLAAAGINTVFFETVNAGYPVYPSRVAPQQNPLIGWDPLAAAVDLAHQRGMTLHAWVWVFAAGNQRHNRLVNLPADYLGPVLAQNPDWAGYDNRGNPIPVGQDKPFLDPANPEVRSYLTQLMAEIVTEYGVDGLHLDYIRYPFQDPAANRTYGYGDAARWRFRSIAGVDPRDILPRPEPSASRSEQMQQRVLWDQWTEFRTQQVTSFVETLSQTLKRQRPELILSAAVFAKPEHERLQKIQQDWGTWAREGYIDWIVLMSYAEDTSRFEQLITPWLVEEDFGSTLVLPGVRILDLSHQAVMDQLQVTRDLPTTGYALFATADLQTDLAQLLAQTQGATGLHSPSPFQMAFDRYQTLQREWSWLLSQQKLWMERDNLTTWVAQANQLETDFQALADSPSRRNLAAVQQSLTQVQAPLEGTILIDTVNGSYRVQAWQHRLTAIERLLRYGEQTEF